MFGKKQHYTLDISGLTLVTGGKLLVELKQENCQILLTTEGKDFKLLIRQALESVHITAHITRMVFESNFTAMYYTCVFKVYHIFTTNNKVLENSS